MLFISVKNLSWFLYNNTFSMHIRAISILFQETFEWKWNKIEIEIEMLAGVRFERICGDLWRIRWTKLCIEQIPGRNFY